MVIESARAAISGAQLVVSTDGSTEDNFSVSFEPMDNGQRLRVIRRIHAKELNEPVIIRSVYNKISEVAQWGIYGEPEVAPSGKPTLASAGNKPTSVPTGSNGASILRTALERWIAATNGKNINQHLSFYMPRLKAFYLARNIPREVVRSERTRL